MRPSWYEYAGDNPLSFEDPLGLKVKNNTNCRIYVKPETSSHPVPVYPGGEYSGAQDGYADPCEFKNQVFKTVDNVDVTIGPDHKPTTSGGGIKGAVGQLTIGGVKDTTWQTDLHKKKDYGWDELFKMSDPSKCLCCGTPR